MLYINVHGTTEMNRLLEGEKSKNKCGKIKYLLCQVSVNTKINLLKNFQIEL